MQTIEDIEARTAAVSHAMEWVKTPAPGPGALEGGVTIIGGLIKVAIVVGAVAWLFFT